jgi:hypothetical protein
LRLGRVWVQVGLFFFFVVSVAFGSKLDSFSFLWLRSSLGPTCTCLRFGRVWAQVGFVVVGCGRVWVRLGLACVLVEFGSKLDSFVFLLEVEFGSDLDLLASWSSLGTSWTFISSPKPKRLQLGFGAWHDSAKRLRGRLAHVKEVRWFGWVALLDLIVHFAQKGDTL